MNKLKNVWNKVSNSIKEVFKNYPVTLVFIYISTIIFTFFIDKIDHDECISTFLIMQMVGSFFVETCVKNKKSEKFYIIIGEGISIILSFICCLFVEDFEIANKLRSVYLILLSVFIVNYFIKKSQTDFKEYAFKYLENFLKISIIYAVFDIGVTIVILIFSELIIEFDNEFKIIWYVIELFTGFYYIPALIYEFTNIKEEVGKFLKGLIRFVCLPLISIGIAIIYLYIIKLIIKGTILKDSIFFILALIYTFAYPIIILLGGMKEKEINIKISKILAFSYLPLIILELIAMNIRVGEYGLTEERYFAYLLIIVEVISFLLFFSKYLNLSVDKIIHVVALLAIIEIITPINSSKISISNQENRIKALMSSKEDYWSLDNEEKLIVKGAYSFLKYEDDEKVDTFINNYFDDIIKQDMNEISSYKKNNYFYSSNYIDSLDISGYKTLIDIDNDQNQFVSSSDIVVNSDEDIIDIANIKLGNNNEQIYSYFDFTNMLEKAKKENQKTSIEKNEFLGANRFISSKDGKYDAIIETLDFEYDDLGNVYDFTVKGYLLEKN